MPATTRAMLLGAALLTPLSALAQGELKPPRATLAPAGPAPAGLAPGAEVEAPLPDPPGRAGRLAVLLGGVSARDPGQAEWQPAERNLPIATGSAIQTGPRGRALLELPGATLALESGSALEWTRLDDSSAEASLPAGQLALLVRALDPDDTLRIATPRGLVEILKPGRYVIAAGAEGLPSRLVALSGQAEWVSPDGRRIPLAGGRALSSEDGPPAISAAAEAPPILAWALAQEPKIDEVPQSAALMPGGRQLAEFGRWSRHPEYGDVWRPDVPAGWAPFRDGQWRWSDPWGWTWRDAQPWGFATSHYGRWFEYQGAWAWAPVVVAAPVVVLAPRRWPVFAPAVVGFFTPPGSWGGGRPLAWAPLAPHEPFWPGRRFSAGYVQRVNAWTVRDAPALGPRWADGPRRLPPPAFANWGAATAVPGAVFAGARPVAPNRLPFSGPPPGALTPAALPPRPVSLAVRPTQDPLRPGAPGLPPLSGRPGAGPPLAALPPAARPGFVPPVEAARPGVPNAPMLPPLGGRAPGLAPPMEPLRPGAPGLPPLGGRPPSDPMRPGVGVPPAARPGFITPPDAGRPAMAPRAAPPGFAPPGGAPVPGSRPPVIANPPPAFAAPPRPAPSFITPPAASVAPRPAPPPAFAAPPPRPAPAFITPPAAMAAPRPAPPPAFAAPPPRPAPSFITPPPAPRPAPQQPNPLMRR